MLRLARCFSSIAFLSLLCATCLAQGQTASECGSVEGKQTETIEGTVCSGQTFSQEFGDRYEFELVPDNEGWGWIIEVIDTWQNFDISRLTPPLHGPNPTYLVGWYFRNEENTGPNTGELNVPQKVRQFRFSPEVRDLIMGDQSRITPHAVERIAEFGTGTLYILDYGLADLNPGQKARMVWLKFKVCLRWKAGP